ncbi:hypothetical protein ACODM8_16795 [Vibrio ostreicida]|uniref:Uncharacterized protein n=2 Tax=Vibrio ostreicida TaxID=526588 RepID=A0ABT8BWF1_9VIBR|nr:hypothetical protein [Vibrio ostreicida]MDN3611341.1 hypothetical protein [Vibrio ostreicida]NPD09278.1 hypothetical protein [Vibrio ostreicida]
METYLFTFFAFAVSLLRTLTVVMLAWLTLRLFDKSLGITFANWWNHADDNAKAVYLGARCIAVFLAFSLCLA